MAKWIEFTADYDHRWASGAVSAFKAGTVAFVKDDVATAALDLKRAKPSKRPEGAPETVHSA